MFTLTILVLRPLYYPKSSADAFASSPVIPLTDKPRIILFQIHVMFQLKNSARTMVSGLRCMIAPAITAIAVTEHPPKQMAVWNMGGFRNTTIRTTTVASKKGMCNCLIYHKHWTLNWISGVRIKILSSQLRSFFIRSMYPSHGWVIASQSILWDAFSEPSMGYLLLATKSSIEIRVVAIINYCGCLSWKKLNYHSEISA